MKKMLFSAAIVALMAAGCQKTELINPVGEPTLSFSTGMGKLTKASDADSLGQVNLQEQNFRVWAYAAADYENTPANDLNQIYDGMENLLVSYHENGVWSTDKQYFWPGVDKDLKFFAVSADATFLGASGTTSTSVQIKLENGQGETGNLPVLTIQDFVVDSTSANEDLMVADFVQQNQDTKAVKLNFHHALSKVEFIFKTVPADSVTVFVQSLEVADLATEGTLTVSPDTSLVAVGTAPVNFDWTVADTTANFADDWTAVAEDLPDEIDPADGVTSEETDETALKLTTKEATFTTWLMLPQSIEDKKVTITYVINERQFQSTFPLYTDALTEWNDNQHIKYKITLAPNLISFNPVVDPWDEPTVVEDEN